MKGLSSAKNRFSPLNTRPAWAMNKDMDGLQRGMRAPHPHQSERHGDTAAFFYLIKHLPPQTLPALICRQLHHFLKMSAPREVLEFHEVTVVSEQGSHAKGVDPLILSCHQTNPEAYRPGRTHRESTATSSQGSREDMAPSRRYHSVNFPNTLSNRPRKCRLRPIQSPSRQPEHKTVSNADPWRLPHPTNPVRVAFTESTAPFSLHPRLHPRLHSRAWHQRPWPFPRQRFRR